MNITQAGLAIVVLVLLIARGGAGRVGIVLAAMCGAAIALIGQLSNTAWNIGETIATVANNFGSTGVG